jgi:hypothetical protein
MTLFIIHISVLLLLSTNTAKRLFDNWTDSIIVAGLLVWLNILLTALVLSSFSSLGSPVWFFRTSVIFSIFLRLAINKITPSDPIQTRGDSPSALSRVLVFLLLPFPIAIFITSVCYAPSNFDSLTYHIPRCVFYLGQGSLTHFSTINCRQVFFPFNYNLLFLVPLVYDAPSYVLSLFNGCLWVWGGLAVYRTCRLSGHSINASIIAVWIGLIATQVLAQASSTTNDLPTASAVIVSALFWLRWSLSKQARDSIMGGLSLGVGLGCKLTTVYFLPGILLIFLIWIYTSRKSRNPTCFSISLSELVLPLGLAFLVFIPFVLFNLAAKGLWMTHEMDYTRNLPFSSGCAIQTTLTYIFQFFFEPLHRFTFNLDITNRLNDFFISSLFKNWKSAHAFSPLYLFPPDLNEDHVWFGFSGPFAMVCALAILILRRRWTDFTSMAAITGLFWFTSFFVLNRWSLYNQRYFIPAFFMLTPSIASFWDLSRCWSSVSRICFQGVALIVVVTSAWFAGSYLWLNTNRPLLPVFTNRTYHSPVPKVPQLIIDRMSKEPYVNSRFLGGNERVFLLMGHREGQKFIATCREDSDAYNLHSFQGYTRNRIMVNSTQSCSYALISIPNKKTPGAERLGGIGSDMDHFEYIGVPKYVNQASTECDSNILVRINYGWTSPNRFSTITFEIIGLLPDDGLELTATTSINEKNLQTLVSCDRSVVSTISDIQPFDRITLNVTDKSNGLLVGNGYITLRTVVDPSNVDLVGDSDALWVYDAIQPGRTGNLGINGLASHEGPYLDYGLPLFRWAKTPQVELKFTSPEDSIRFKLSLSARLQVRNRGRLEIIANGESLGIIDFDGVHKWIDKTYTFRSRPVNSIILRDIPIDNAPPPSESLYFLFSKLIIEGY